MNRTLRIVSWIGVAPTLLAAVTALALRQVGLLLRRDRAATPRVQG